MQPAASKQSSTPFICYNHCQWVKEAWECANPKHCQFLGNSKARGISGCISHPLRPPWPTSGLQRLHHRSTVFGRHWFCLLNHPTPVCSSTFWPKYCIVAADRSPISCWGRHVRTVSSGQHSFMWSFLHAAVAFPILGANFLKHFNFMVDIKNKRLVGPGHSYMRLSAPQSSLNLVPVRVVADHSVIPAGGAQQPQAASLCGQPPAAIISQQPAGVAQQPQAAGQCARPPYSDTTPQPLGWFTPVERQGVAVVCSMCAWPPAADICQ